VITHVTFGIIIDDIVFPEGITRMGVLGGGGSQTAWGMAAALGSGATVGLVAGTGPDLDSAALAPLRAAGINLEGVRLTDHPTPRAWQTVEFDGRRTQVWRVPVESLGVQLARSRDVLPGSYFDARWFHWGIHPGDPESLAFARWLRDHGHRVSLEPFRPPERPLADSEMRDLLAACDVFSPNWLEAVRLAGADDHDGVIARFDALGCRILVLRRGPDGAEVWNLPERRGVYVPAVQTSIVDVVGAGNAFCGALVARLHDPAQPDDSLADAACHASAAASYLIEQVGLPPTPPDPADYARRVSEARSGLRALSLA